MLEYDFGFSYFLFAKSLRKPFFMPSFAALKTKAASPEDKSSLMD